MVINVFVLFFSDNSSRYCTGNKVCKIAGPSCISILILEFSSKRPFCHLKNVVSRDEIAAKKRKVSIAIINMYISTSFI
jgi:hypothetical protein